MMRGIRVSIIGAIGFIGWAPLVHSQYLEPPGRIPADRVDMCIRISVDPMNLYPPSGLSALYPSTLEPREAFRGHKARLLSGQDASRFLRDGRPCPVAPNVYGVCEGPATDKDRSENFAWCLRFGGWRWAAHPTQKFDVIPDADLQAQLKRHLEGSASDRAEVEKYFRDEFARIDPIFAMILANQIAQAGRVEDALFWYYAGVIRWRVGQEISRDENRGAAGAAIAMAFGMNLPQEVANDTALNGRAIERALQFERSQAYEPGYLRQPFDEQRPEWPRILETARNRLAQSAKPQSQ